MSNNSYTLADASEQRKDLGLAIQSLINTNLTLLNTCFLAEIVSFKGSLVCVKSALKGDKDEQDLILNNIMVGFAYSGEWQTQFKLKVGDIGLCLVNNRDLSFYKQNGKSGLVPTSRSKDVNDSIFLPLSLFKTLNISDCDYTIKSGDGNEITFKSGSLKVNANDSVAINANDSVAITAKNDMSFTSNNFNVSAKSGVSIKGTASAKIESPTTTIQSPAITLGGNVSVSGGISMGGAMASASGSPISIGTGSATLGSCFDAVFAAMDLLASGMTGETTNPSAYNGGKSALQAQIKGVVK